jgi:hypothetical protein
MQQHPYTPHILLTLARPCLPSPPPAEYLKIEDIRSSLTPRESPFVIDNNAGGGFGKHLGRGLEFPQSAFHFFFFFNFLPLTLSPSPLFFCSG